MMTRFYFDTAGSDGECRDEEGLEFASFAHARSEALAALGEIAADEMRRGLVASHSIRVRDSAGREIYSVTVNLRETGRGPSSVRSAA